MFVPEKRANPRGRFRSSGWSLHLDANHLAARLDHEVHSVPALLSGPCASDGRESVIKVTQNGFLPYDHTYLNVPAGAIIEKTFHLQVWDIDLPPGRFRDQNFKTRGRTAVSDLNR